MKMRKIGNNLNAKHWTNTYLKVERMAAYLADLMAAPKDVPKAAKMAVCLAGLMGALTAV